ncbi:MAG: hypothetical protein U0792_19590 [Gemmataceae bacterium]
MKSLKVISFVLLTGLFSLGCSQTPSTASNKPVGDSKTSQDNPQGKADKKTDADNKKAHQQQP